MHAPSQSAVLTFALLMLAGSASAQVTFTPLGFSGGINPYSTASGISEDGSTIVGESPSPNTGDRPEAYKLQGSTRVLLGFFDTSNHPTSVATAVNTTGSVVVGFSAYNNIGLQEGFRRSGGIITNLGDLATGPTISEALCVSGTGSVAAGWGTTALGANSRHEAFIYPISTNVMTSLGFLTGHDSSEARGISRDGTIIVGISSSATESLAFRWTQGTGMTSIGDLAGGIVESEAMAISADGLTIVGTSTSADGQVAFRWTQATGMVSIGDLPGGTVSAIARAVSADGSVIVGDGSNATSGSDGEAFIWDAQNGMRAVRDVLIAAGVNMTGWRLFSATGISGDGTRIVGNGLDPDGLDQAWLAVIPSAPPIQCADYNADGRIDPDDLADYINDFFELIAVPGGYAGSATQATNGFGRPCPDAPDVPQPNSLTNPTHPNGAPVDAYRTNGYKCSIGLNHPDPCTPANGDDLSDFINLFFDGC